MKNLEEIKNILTKHKPTLEKQFSVKEIGVFGSYVGGFQNDYSDVDILVEFSKPIGFFKFLELEECLTELLGIKVDLVSKKALKPRIGKHIMQELVLI